MGLLADFLVLTLGKRELDDPWGVVEPPDSMSARLLALVKDNGTEMLVPPGCVSLFLKLFLAFNLKKGEGGMSA